MKTLMLLLSLIATSQLFADPKNPSQKPDVKIHAELKRDIAKLENQLSILKVRLAKLERELGVSIPANGNILLDVLPDGRVSVDNIKLTRALLEKKLRQVADVSKEVSVVIRGNGNVEYQLIVEIIDLCQKVGIHNISFATRKQTKQPNKPLRRTDK